LWKQEIVHSVIKLLPEIKILELLIMLQYLKPMEGLNIVFFFNFFFTTDEIFMDERWIKMAFIDTRDPNRSKLGLH
jgi:hypothetical protein